MKHWPHQSRAIEEVTAAFARGERRVLLTVPTGGGKTEIASSLISQWLEQDLNIILYSNRKMLVRQTSRVLAAAGHAHGVRAAGYDDDRGHRLQVSSIQTEHSRVLKRKTWDLHPADRVIIDEAHLQGEATAKQILGAHYQAGAHYLGLTATPLGLGHLYETLLVCGTPSELRACGALVPAIHYSPDEPDMRAFKGIPLGEEISEAKVRRAIMTEGVFGRILEHYEILNPAQEPGLCFGPDVAGSLWIAEQFEDAGIAAAHIDGKNCWLRGKLYPSSDQLRQDILGMSRDGKVKVICNRYVLREGIDAPWLRHCIVTTVFGSLQTYLQSLGRMLRAAPGKTHATIQDHGGNWWRHGSVNADRHWSLEYTAKLVSDMHEDRLRQRKCRRCGLALRPMNPWCAACGFCNEIEPVRCPKCSRVVNGPRCPCGHEMQAGTRSRIVVQSDGTLKEMRGDVFRPHRLSQRPDVEVIWRRMYYRGLKANLTFKQCEALFAKENNWGWPPRSLPLMPTQEIDWFRRVADVPKESLT